MTGHPHYFSNYIYTVLTIRFQVNYWKIHVWFIEARDNLKSLFLTELCFLSSVFITMCANEHKKMNSSRVQRPMCQAQIRLREMNFFSFSNVRRCFSSDRKKYWPELWEKPAYHIYLHIYILERKRYMIKYELK